MYCSCTVLCSITLVHFCDVLVLYCAVFYYSSTLMWSCRCAAGIGRWPNYITPMYISSSCSVGNMMHELLHTLGLFHEQSRTDRDQYVTINTQNIRSGERTFIEPLTPKVLIFFLKTLETKGIFSIRNHHKCLSQLF